MDGQEVVDWLNAPAVHTSTEQRVRWTGSVRRSVLTEKRGEVHEGHHHVVGGKVQFLWGLFGLAPNPEGRERCSLTGKQLLAERGDRQDIEERPIRIEDQSVDPRERRNRASRRRLRGALIRHREPGPA